VLGAKRVVAVPVAAFVLGCAAERAFDGGENVSFGNPVLAFLHESERAFLVWG
jgi:hypothetical protein